MHANIARVPIVTSSAERKRTRGITGLVYGAVRGVTRAVGSGLDTALALVEPLLARVPNMPAREAVVSALNGVFGDHMAAQNNALAITMTLRRGGETLTLTRESLRSQLPDISSKIVVLVHGLCMNDLQWQSDADPASQTLSHDHGIALANDLGYTPLYLHYNTGQHVSSNGRAFATVLKNLIAAWPIPVESVVIVAHSMGGLVSRSAFHYGRKARHAWCKLIDKIIFLGTPHHGAPLERGGSWIDLILSTAPYASPLAKLGKARSAGITDLRHGGILDQDWQGNYDAPEATDTTDMTATIPLPSRVRCYTIAANIADMSSTRAGVRDATIGATQRLIGDGLVPVSSALGQHSDPLKTLCFPTSHQVVLTGLNHMDLLKAPQVYPILRDFVAQ
jgi:pimeloyl-ACP methyl ester carboxylesterase